LGEIDDADTGEEFQIDADVWHGSCPPQGY
jgi:hypothetical protein